MTALERALADLVGGSDGGYTLWAIACEKLARAGRDSQDDYRFRVHPGGAMNRLLVGVEDALRVAGLAVELELAISGEDAGAKTGDDRAADVAALLLDRARSLVDSRLNDPPRAR